MQRRAMACAALVGAVLLVIPATAPATEGDGAPKKATVKFESLMGVPADGYSLVCPPGLPSCTTTGTIDLETKAEVPVTWSKNLGATYGIAPLAYSKAEGSASMTFTCEGMPDPFVSKLSPSGTTAGELEIASVKALPGTNMLAVALNHGGDTGEEYPRETYSRSDGGCGAPNFLSSPLMGTWYYNFYVAHRESQQPTTNDLELQGLYYNNGAYVKSYDRFINVSNGGTIYPLYERTWLEVEPEFCEGARNRVSSATGEGRSLGLDGASFYPGQRIWGPPKTKISLGDGSRMEMEKGGEFEIEKCEEDETAVSITHSIGKFWTHVKKAFGGGNAKFEVTTKRTVAGVRGTTFAISYNEKKELTKLWVMEHTVSFKGRNGAKGKVLVHAGQVAVQKGKGAPKIIKR
jgi:FecR-like protein